MDDEILGWVMIGVGVFAFLVIIFLLIALRELLFAGLLMGVMFLVTWGLNSKK